MKTTDMATTDSGEILVRIDPEENWYVRLARAAVEAEQCGRGLRLVFTAVPRRDQQCGAQRRSDERDAGGGTP